MSTAAALRPPSGLLRGALISPVADVLLIAGSPLIALAITAVAAGAPAHHEALIVGVSVLIAAHLAITFVHTHGNEAIFRAHPWRFTLVPPLLLAALVASPLLRAIAVPLAVAWDVHHSGMQTFGLARLYARKAGNAGGAGRTLDLLLCHASYAGPLLAGAGLALHVQRSGSFSWRDVILARLDDPALLPWRAAVIGLVAATVSAHAIGTWRLARRGVPVSPWALVLLATTALASVVSWGFNSFGLALVTMKLFHCVQYFAIVAVAERKQVAGWLGRAPQGASLPLVALVLLLPALAFGGGVAILGLDQGGLGLSLVLSVTLLHFWYDGFTWSARRTETT